MKKQLWLLLLCLTGCSSLQPSAPVLPFSLLEKLSPNTSEIYTIDMGDPKSTASFGVKLNFRSEGFKTLDSQSGHVPYTLSMIQGIRVFLVSSPSFPAPGTLTPFGGNIYTINQTFSAPDKNLVFHNVGPGSYFVAASVFITGIGPFNASTNLSKATGFTYSEGNVAVSNLGGMGGADNGRVVVDAHYQIIGSDQVVVPIALEDEVGAKIEATVNLIDNP